MKEPKLFSDSKAAAEPTPNSRPLPVPAPTPKAQGEFKSALEQSTLERQLELIREMLARGNGGGS